MNEYGSSIQGAPVSVIVPVYNRPDIFPICLNALIRSLREGDELLIIDDGSKKNVAPYVNEMVNTFINNNPHKKFVRDQVKTHRLLHNEGQGHARNHGAGIAKNDIFVFIDSDIEVFPDTIEKIRSFFAIQNDTSAITGRLSKKHPFKNFFSRYKNLYMYYIFGEQEEQVNFLYGSITAIKRDSFIPWQEKFLGVEDTELGMNLVSLGFKIQLLKDLEVVHHKFFSLGSIIKNDFWVPFGFARSFWLFSGWNAYLRMPFAEKEEGTRFSHISYGQVCSLFASFFILLSFVASLCLEGDAIESLGGTPLILIGMIAFLGLNIKFFHFLMINEGIVFLLKSVFWTFIDQIIMMAGAIFGLTYHGFLQYIKPLVSGTVPSTQKNHLDQ